MGLSSSRDSRPMARIPPSNRIVTAQSMMNTLRGGCSVVTIKPLIANSTSVERLAALNSATRSENDTLYQERWQCPR